MSLKTQVVHGLKWQAISIAGKQFLGLLVFTTLARLLEPTAFGLVALIGVYLGIVSMLVDQGIGTALIQKQGLQQEHKDTAFWFNMGCALILCLGTVALAGPVSSLFKEPRLAPLLRWSSLGLVIGASSAIHATLFIKEMDFRRPVLRDLIANAVGGTVGVGMALTGCGVWSLIGQQLATGTAGAIFLWVVSEYRPAWRFSLPHFRELFGVSSSVFAISILWYLSTRLDQIVIGRFAGIAVLGNYSVAGKIPGMASMVTQQTLSAVSLPSLSRLQSNHAKMRQAVSEGMELNAAISFAIFVGLAVIAPDLVPLLFGAKWAAAVVLCSLLSLYGLVDVLLVFCHPVLLASGGIGKYVWLNVWHVFGVLVSCVVGIQFGISYLVIGLIANSLIIAIPALLFVQNRIGLSPMSYCKPCLVPALAALAMAGTIWLMTNFLSADFSPVMRVSLKILIGALVYIGCTWVFAPSVVRNLILTVQHGLGRSKALSFDSFETTK